MTEYMEKEHATSYSFSLCFPTPGATKNCVGGGGGDSVGDTGRAGRGDDGEGGGVMEEAMVGAGVVMMATVFNLLGNKNKDLDKLQPKGKKRKISTPT